MKNVFDPAKHYMALVSGQHFETNGIFYEMPGRFAADTVDRFDPLTQEREFAVFTVDEPDEKSPAYPFTRAGTFYLPMSVLSLNPPREIP